MPQVSKIRSVYWYSQLALSILIAMGTVTPASASFLTRPSFEVLNTEDGQIYPAAENADGQLIVFPRGAFIFGSVVDTNSPYQRFSSVVSSRYFRESIIQAHGQTHQVQNLYRTQNGELYLAVRTLKDDNVSAPHYQSANGIFMDEAIIPLSAVTAYQLPASQCSTPTQFVQANGETTPRQAVETLRQQSSTGSSQPVHNPLAMDVIGCLSNGQLILSTIQERLASVPGGRRRFNERIYDIVSPNGQSQLSNSLSQAWVSTQEILNTDPRGPMLAEPTQGSRPIAASEETEASVQ